MASSCSPSRSSGAPHWRVTPEVGTQQRGCCRSPRAHDQLGPDGVDLGLEPWPASSHLRRRRLLVQPALPLWAPLEVFDGVGGDVPDSGSMPARSRPLDNTVPAGPTKGTPRLSSTSPGCSPTNIRWLRRGPAPNTVWVARSCRWQPRHPAAARRNSLRLCRSGRKASAPTARTYPASAWHDQARRVCGREPGGRQPGGESR